MGNIQCFGPADRHTNAVNGERVVLTDGRKRPMWRAASAHIVFCMNLEESVAQSVREDRRQVLMLETCPGEPLGASCRVKGTIWFANCRCHRGIAHGRPVPLVVRGIRTSAG